MSRPDFTDLTPGWWQLWVDGHPVWLVGLVQHFPNANPSFFTYVEIDGGWYAEEYDLGEHDGGTGLDMSAGYQEWLPVLAAVRIDYPPMPSPQEVP